MAATTAIAAGAILTMIADTMIPEAFEHTPTFAGFITVLGFRMAFILSKMGVGPLSYCGLTGAPSRDIKAHHFPEFRNAGARS